MKPKTIVTALLLTFVAASVGVLVVQELRPAKGEDIGGAGHRVVVYYLHGMKRCDACRAIEAAAHKAVEQGFPEELKDGRLEWRLANYEAPGNERFARDYDVMASTVVLVSARDGKQVGWKNLEDDVWKHFADREALMRVVREQVAAMLEED